MQRRADGKLLSSAMRTWLPINWLFTHSASIVPKGAKPTPWPEYGYLQYPISSTPFRGVLWCRVSCAFSGLWIMLSISVDVFYWLYLWCVVVFWSMSQLLGLSSYHPWPAGHCWPGPSSRKPWFARFYRHPWFVGFYRPWYCCLSFPLPYIARHKFHRNNFFVVAILLASDLLPCLPFVASRPAFP